jgi:hypothetical protein
VGAVSAVSAAMTSPRQLRSAIRLQLLLALSGLLIVAWTLLPHGLWHHLGFVSLAIPLGYVARTRGGGSSGADAEARESARTLALAIPALAYFYWGRAVGVRIIHLVGSLVFLVGFVLFAGVVGERALRPWGAWAGAILVAGLVVMTADRGMLGSRASIDTAFGAMMVVGGVATSILLGYSDRTAGGAADGPREGSNPPSDA